MSVVSPASRRMRFSPLVLGLISVLLLVIVPPVIFLIQSSLHETNFDGSFGDLTLRYYRELVDNDRFLALVANTAAYAFGSALVALTLGGIQAWIVERTDTPLRRSMVVVSIVSLGIPSVLYTISFLLLLGRTGPLNQLLMWLLGTSEPVFNVYTLGGMILVQGIEYTPLCFLLLSAVFRSNDAAFEEASMMSGAGLGTTFRRITFKLETPALVGLPGRVRVLTSDIYQTMLEIPPNYGEASAFSVIMLIIMAFLLYLYGNFSRNAEKYQTISGKGFRPRVIGIGRWKIATSMILAALFMVLIGFPIGITLWVSFVPYYDGINLAALQRFSLNNFSTVIFQTAFASSIGNTF